MKTLKNLLQSADQYRAITHLDQKILGLSLDSRKLKPGYLFVAMKGTQTDGHQYINQAIQKGAVAVLCEELPHPLPDGIGFIQSDEPQRVLGALAAAFYNDPSRDLKLIGITGTNGKTSIATWLYDLFIQLGYPAGLLSTIQVLVNGNASPASHTTPDVISLNQYLAAMVDAGCEFAVMEVSSHALAQQRTAGLHFTGAVFTNLTRDHLDYHTDFSDYLQAKKKLFDGLSKDAFALVNHDDKNGVVMLQNCAAQSYSYASAKPADFRVKIVEKHPQGMTLSIGKHELWTPVIGQYNASNLLAVYAVAQLLQLKEEEVLLALSALKPVEGRLEVVDLGHTITALVDYAHTPDALKNVLKALNDTRSGSARIITVVGAGGDRDPGKRPKMAQAAIEGSDQVILTADNPRTENPETILDHMTSGLSTDQLSRTLRISNRREAIKTAVALAQPGDLILVAGKGHENYQEINGVKHPFDDVEELKKLRKN